MERYLLRMVVVLTVWLAIASVASAQTAVEYIHTDALGTPVAVTNSAGAVIERSVYEPYGQLINRPLTDGPGFTGHVQDAATGLTYMQQRYYDPQVGLFLSVDPVKADSDPVGQFHRFRYANNNPYRFKDPDGRIVETIWDAANVGIGVASLISNAKEGRWGAVTVDAVGVVLDSAATVFPVVPGGAGTAIRAARGVDAASDAVKATRTAGDGVVSSGADIVGGGLVPKAPTGPGKVAPSERDPQRFFTPDARAAKRAEQGGACGTGCGKGIDGTNSRGHHVERHADGGKTTPDNHVEVCVECHTKLHSK